MKKFSHWVFDLDGTILNSSKHYEVSIEAILIENGVVPTAADRELAYKYFNPADYFAIFFANELQVKNAVQRLIDLNHHYADQIPIFPGIPELLSFLRSKNIRLSAWTGRELSSAVKILELTGLKGYFETCVGRTCVANNKPHPDGLLKILEDSKHHYDDVVMVGDHEYDMLGAQAAKVRGISVNWEGKVGPEARLLSDLHFDRIEELHSWAKNLYL